MRKIQSEDKYFNSAHLPESPWTDDMYWPAKWIRCRDPLTLPFIAAYRLRFTQKEDLQTQIHVSADERYELFLNGVLIGRGPERSDPAHWCYETYELSLGSGSHILSARVWSLAHLSPGAQMSSGHGFLLACDSIPLSTGYAKWESLEIQGISFPENPRWEDTVAGIRNIIDFSKYSDEYIKGRGENWHPAIIKQPALSSAGAGHLANPPYMSPAMLPPMMNKQLKAGKVRVINIQSTPQKAELSQNLPEYLDPFQQLLDDDKAVTIPANSAIWVLVDLENYYCLYPEIALSGSEGARVEVSFSESLTTVDKLGFATPKGNRSEIDGKYWLEFHGDTFVACANRSGTAQPLWFRSGRWMAISVTTKSTPLSIEKLRLFETRYPLENKASFKTFDPIFSSLEPILFRTLQMCCHETFFDCPYYEQQMYLGDTRLQALLVYVLNGDSRPARKAVKLFDWSRSFKGLTTSRYPSKGRQTIPPFSLIWIGMIHDHIMWSPDDGIVKELLPGIRAVIESWESQRHENGLVAAPAGWNFVDWSRPEGFEAGDQNVPRWAEVEVNSKIGVKWDKGVPPEGHPGGFSGVLNLLYIYTLSYAIELEEKFGEVHLGARLRSLQSESFSSICKHFFSDKYGMFADNLNHTLFSEHSQCLALLTQMGEDGIRSRVMSALFDSAHVKAETTVYFSHYYFEACRVTGRMDKFAERFKKWSLFTQLGLKTGLEEPEPSRSDCHAWSSHPLFHWYATIAGVRPIAPGFKKVHIKPQLGDLPYIKAIIPYKNDFIRIEIERKDGQLTGVISLPPDLPAIVEINGLNVNIEGATDYTF